MANPTRSKIAVSERLAKICDELFLVLSQEFHDDFAFAIAAKGKYIACSNAVQGRIVPTTKIKEKK